MLHLTGEDAELEGNPSGEFSGLLKMVFPIRIMLTDDSIIIKEELWLMIY